MTPNPYQVYADLQSPRFVRFRSPCVVRFLTVQVSFHSDVLDRLFPVIYEKSHVHSMKFYKSISDSLDRVFNVEDWQSLCTGSHTNNSL